MSVNPGYFQPLLTIMNLGPHNEPVQSYQRRHVATIVEPHQGPPPVNVPSNSNINSEARDRVQGPRRDQPRQITTPASTRRAPNRLAWIDRPTGRVIRRYERAHPGELIHLDIRKVGKIPPGCGWCVCGRGQVKTRRVGYTYVHCELLSVLPARYV